MLTTRSSYYPNGKPFEIVDMKDDLKHGRYRRFREDGSWNTECNYEDDVLDGDFYMFHKNNKVMVKTRFKKGLIDGEFRVQDSEWRPLLSVFFLEGVRHGRYIQYHRNGIKKVECNYYEGLIVGEYVERYENGALAAEGFFDPYYSVEEMRRVYPSQRLKETYTKIGGKYNGLRRCYYENGQLSLLATYKDGEETSRTEFLSNGEEKR